MAAAAATTAAITLFAVPSDEAKGADSAPAEVAPSSETSPSGGGYEYEDEEEYSPPDYSEYDDSGHNEGCAGDCTDMDHDGRTSNDVDADGDGLYESR